MFLTYGFESHQEHFKFLKKANKLGLPIGPGFAFGEALPYRGGAIPLKAKRVNVLGLSDGCLHQLFGAFRKSLSQGSLA